MSQVICVRGSTRISDLSQVVCYFLFSSCLVSSLLFFYSILYPSLLVSSFLFSPNKESCEGRRSCRVLSKLSWLAGWLAGSHGPMCRSTHGPMTAVVGQCTGGGILCALADRRPHSTYWVWRCGAWAWARGSAAAKRRCGDVGSHVKTCESEGWWPLWRDIEHFKGVVVSSRRGHVRHDGLVTAMCALRKAWQHKYEHATFFTNMNTRRSTKYNTWLAQTWAWAQPALTGSSGSLYCEGCNGGSVDRNGSTKVFYAFQRGIRALGWLDVGLAV